MIRVVFTGANEYLLEPVGGGAWLPARKLVKDQLPLSVSRAMASLEIHGMGVPVPHIGVQIDDYTWELFDESLCYLTAR